ncbi:MAG: MBL fold metallo-hydrolase [bacterium]
MRELIVTFSILFGIFILFSAQANIDSIEILYYGHSMFLIKNDEVSIVTDPFNPSIGYKFPELKADIVTVSHEHFDHNYTSGIKGDPVIVRSNTKARGVSFSIIPSYHDEVKGKLRGENRIVRWTLNGVSFAHLGDFGEKDLSDNQYCALKGVNVIFIPAGGFYTIDAETAYKIIQKIKPNYAILMHYRTQASTIKELAPLGDIMKVIPGIEIVPSKLEISKKNLPKTTNIVAMDYIK